MQLQKTGVSRMYFSINAYRYVLGLDNSGSLQPDCSFEIVVHRTVPPEYLSFAREDIQDVLLAGDDSHANSLVMDYEGHLKLLPLIDRTTRSILEYPVRYETFHAGNGYAGNIDDFRFVENVFLSMLEGWAKHIDTGRLFYMDYVSGASSEDELLAMLGKR